MKATFISIVLNLIMANLFAQNVDSTITHPKRNSVSIELLSGPVIYSINYQYVRFTDVPKKIVFTYQIGASVIPLYQAATARAGVVIGKPRSSFEVLIGGGYLRTNTQKITEKGRIYLEGIDPADNNLFLSPQLSYRRQIDSKGIVGKFSFLPWVIVSPFVSQVRLTPGIGLSFGKAF